MLSTSNVSANQAETYYTREDACAAEPEQIFARWLGQGATTLSLPVRVEPEDFQSLLRGFSPVGQALFGRSVGAAKRRAATDYTFSAPKSVSIAALVQRDERVLQAHQQAIEQSLSVMEERYAQTRISTSTGQQYTPTDNLIAAIFTHTTSREMEPQLHSHCVVINATQLPNGRWYSFSNEAAIAHQKLLGQIYQNELAVSLQRLGYQIEPRSQGQFELVGYKPELLQLFSTRRQQILMLLEDWERKGVQILDDAGNVKYDSRSHREAAALQSRKRKARAIEPDKLVKGWNALVKLKGLELPPVPQGAITDLAAASHKSVKAAVAAAIQQCGETGGFKQTQLEQFVLEHHIGSWSFDEIQQAIAEYLTDQTVQQDAIPQQIIEPVGNRSMPFGDAISRARQQRMLYATRVTELAQPRNFSPLTFLKQVNTDAQTSQTTTAFLDRPDFPRSAEYSDRECFEPTSAVDAARAESTAAGDFSASTGDTAVEQQLATLARSLDESLESLAEAIADHHAEQCFVECAGELAAAVAAVDQGIEYLEQSTQARSEFAAAVARLHAAARSEARRLERRLTKAREQRQQSPQLKAIHSSKNRYRQMWKRYSQEVLAGNPIQLDYQVARRAMADGQDQKEVALMLVAGSPSVKAMEHLHGKEKAIAYVNQTTKATCLRMQAERKDKQRKKTLELRDTVRLVQGSTLERT